MFSPSRAAREMSTASACNATRCARYNRGCVLLLSGRELAGSGAVDEGKMVLQWCLGSNRREHWLTNFCSCGSLSDEMNARYSSELL